MDASAGRPGHPASEIYRYLGDDDGSAVSVILKLRGETCDIDCLYCYEKRKEAPGGARISADQVRCLPAIFRGRSLAVELHGGEPLTAGPAHVASVLWELAGQPSVLRVSLQTNGVLLDDAWLDLFEELYPALRIGISLDGDPDGNAWRVGYDGRPVYPQVAAALELLASRGWTAGVITAVTPAVLGRAEAVLDHLAGFTAVRAVSFVPCFDASVQRATAVAGSRVPASRVLQRAALGNGGPGWAILPGEYAEFVLAASAHWISAGYFTRLKMEPAVSAIRRLRGLDSGFCHFSDLKCDHVFTLYPGGRLGSCDELPWPQALLVTLGQDDNEDAVRAAQQRSPVLSQGRNLMTRCLTCDYRDTCGGGCTATRWRQHLAGDEDSYCRYRMRMIDGIAALIAQPAHPEGAWCRTARSRPRHPNAMPNVAAFIARWDARQSSRPVQVRVSAYGNINAAGLPGVHEAADLHPACPQWRQAIEEGIWPLVDAITTGWGLITYDSCQGHAYAGTDLPPAERRVGILPRNRDEYAATASALCRAITSVVRMLPCPVCVLLARADLTCEATGRSTPVLDLALRPASERNWAEYFTAVDQATTALASALSQERPVAGASCSCPSRPDALP